ncbi:hypothetical protein [Anaerotignum lactatifermentans]|nr:hypothetical protein [Anaerotignum lactatifermentans]
MAGVCGANVLTTHRKEVRTVIYGWRLRSKRVDHCFPSPSA